MTTANRHIGYFQIAIEPGPSDLVSFLVQHVVVFVRCNTITWHYYCSRIRPKQQNGYLLFTFLNVNTDNIFDFAASVRKSRSVFNWQSPKRWNHSGRSRDTSPNESSFRIWRRAQNVFLSRSSSVHSHSFVFPTAISTFYWPHACATLDSENSRNRRARLQRARWLPIVSTGMMKRVRGNTSGEI